MHEIMDIRIYKILFRKIEWDWAAGTAYFSPLPNKNIYMYKNLKSTEEYIMVGKWFKYINFVAFKE